jgi:hypothetical protein
LRILLGNEPVLQPHEKLYRQLLAGETAEAAKDAETWLEKDELVKYLDEIAIPTLRIASDDRARAALSAEQVEKLKNSLADYIGGIREALDFKREQLGPERSEALEKAATTVVIAGRGPIDQAAAELVVEAIQFELKMAVQCPSPGGLTGISTVAAAARDAPIDVAALISVGEVTVPQLNLLVSRTRRAFNGLDIVLGYWATHGLQSSAAFDSTIPVAETVSSLVRTVGRMVAERGFTPRRTPPLKVI